MNSSRTRIALFATASCLSLTVSAYEINNHADMSQQAADFSSLSTDSKKLSRLGLKQRILGDDKQTFPLGTGLGPIPYCFGSARPAPWLVTMTEPGAFSALLAQPPKDSTTAQPDWMSNADNVKLTIAQFIGYGACYEDEEHPAKSAAHFYNPQADGQGSNVLGIPLGPNSLEWMHKHVARSTELKDLRTTSPSSSLDREFV